MPASEGDVQPEDLLQVYLAYRSLLQTGQRDGRQRLGGTLLLLCEQGTPARLRATAARIAGAAALMIEPTADKARQATRAGHCDFLVKSLDEALRILKNELRQRASVAVCLWAEPSAILAECVERGVQPDLVDQAVEPLIRRGARQVRWLQKLADYEIGLAWTASLDPLLTMQNLDRCLLASLESDDWERRTWLAQAGPALGRTYARTRFLPLTRPYAHQCGDARTEIRIKEPGEGRWRLAEPQG